MVTFCNRLIAFLYESMLQYLPIVLCKIVVILICKNSTYINNREEPLLLLFIPRRADFLLFKDMYILQFHIQSIIFDKDMDFILQESECRMEKINMIDFYFFFLDAVDNGSICL